MIDSVLNEKSILAVDDEPDVLEVLEEEILAAAPRCRFDKVTSYFEAYKKLGSKHYDIVILDIMGVRGFHLLDLAVKRNLLVTMLTAHSLNPESLKRSIEKKARAYLPKEKLGEIVPFLEDILKEVEFLSGWARLMKQLSKYFNHRWGQNWQKPNAEFWKEFEEKTSPIKRRA
ncbi:MAG: response regulator [Syntrophaceae bacterium]|nr:response regulator [Syntrophaceae bacterium]